MSNGVFTDRGNNKNINFFTGSLNLSPSIKYIGKYAFFNFKKATGLSFGTNSQLLVLGGYAFCCIGQTATPSIKVVLPKTLDDSVAKSVKINSVENSDYNKENWAAVGPYAFGCKNNNETTGIISVEMEECDDDLTYTTSLAPNAFARSGNITRFKSNRNLYFVGADAFKNCNKMREMFLSTNKTKDLDKDGCFYYSVHKFSGNEELKQSKLVIRGETRQWLNERGINTKNYSRR